MAKDDRSRFSVGSDPVTHRGHNTITTVGNKDSDKFIETLDSSFEYQVGFIPAGYEHRPDLISNIFFGTPAYWWLLLEVNNITDPFEGFNVGDRILIPTKI
tara:strand:- start:2110 stop:2412 length:303 start_codon:yes stop_codon:yes gene_type:complete